MSKRAVGPSPGEFEAYPMDFAFSEKTKEFERRLLAFMYEHIYPNEPRYYVQTERNRWKPTRIIEELKPKARTAGLWNIFLPVDEKVAGVSILGIAAVVVGIVPTTGG